MRYLSLDLGTKTIGLAISDRTCLIATSYKVLRHDNDPKSCLLALQEIINQEQITALVLGLPKNMNNTLGKRANDTLEFKKILEETTNLPVYLEDERLTTVSAEHILIEGKTRRDKRKKIIDKVAATIILQTYLDRRKNNGI